MGIKLAIDYPEKVKHLVVIGSQPTGAIPIQPLPQEGLRLIAEYYEGDGPSIERMRAVVRSLVYDDSLLTDDFIKERYEEHHAQPNRPGEGDRRQVQDLYFELERNRVPTLVVWGMEDRGGALEVGLLMTQGSKTPGCSSSPSVGIGRRRNTEPPSTVWRWTSSRTTSPALACGCGRWKRSSASRRTVLPGRDVFLEEVAIPVTRER